MPQAFPPWPPAWTGWTFQQSQTTANPNQNEPDFPHGGGDREQSSVQSDRFHRSSPEVIVNSVNAPEVGLAGHPPLMSGFVCDPRVQDKAYVRGTSME